MGKVAAGFPPGKLPKNGKDFSSTMHTLNWNQLEGRNQRSEVSGEGGGIPVGCALELRCRGCQHFKTATSVINP